MTTDGDGMYKLRVKRHFDAAHYLPEHGGQCANLHGHRWEVEVEVVAREVGSGGMVIDFADVKQSLDSAIADMDHANLNDLPEFSIVPPTAENVAVVVRNRVSRLIRGVSSVTVWESPSASVTYCVDPADRVEVGS